jgi:hypothetical protein
VGEGEIRIYRVESAALPKPRIFRDAKKAYTFAKRLAKRTTHKVLIRFAGGCYFLCQTVMFVFNENAANAD